MLRKCRYAVMCSSQNKYQKNIQELESTWKDHRSPPRQAFLPYGIFLCLILINNLDHFAKSSQLILASFLSFPESFIKIAFRVMLLIDRQTNQHWQKHNLIGRGNEEFG